MANNTSPPRKRRNDADDWSSSDDDDDDDDDDIDDDEDLDDDDRPAFYSICGYSRIDPSSSPSFPSLESALRHDVERHGFDLLRHLPPSYDEDDFFAGTIIAVNACRRFAMDDEEEEEGGTTTTTTTTTTRRRGDEDDDDDAAGGSSIARMSSLGERLNRLLIDRGTKYGGGAAGVGGGGGGGDDDEDDAARHYRPALEDDAMLMCMDEMLDLKRRREEEEEGGGGTATTNGADRRRPDDDASDTAAAADESEATRALRLRVSKLEGELARAKACIAALVVDDDDDDDDDGSYDDEGRRGRRGGRRRKSDDNDGPAPLLPAAAVSDDDTYYFASYSHTSIHETMLRDDVRTDAYENAILSNAEVLFKDKTVLDVGCGTGVLSLFCAKAGARRVIAVDNSDVIEQAREISRLNGYDDVVTFVRGKMETLLGPDGPGLPLSDGEAVDVIVSEWMGYALFFETMLPSVMAARDAVMTPDTGTMFPNISRLYVEGGSDGKRLDYWNDVHGINMSPMKERMASELTREAWVELVDDGNIVTNRAMLIEHDLNSCADEDLDFDAPFELRLRRRDGSSSEDDDVAVEVHQLVISFDIDFAVPGTRAVGFSTGCQSAPTHWKQAVLWFDPVHNCPVLGGDEVMRGTFRMKRNGENHRSIDICVSWETGKIGNDGVLVRKMDGVMRRSLIA
ncbi:hypothetical protein ACHAW5_011143 [Stephanodiscus triporus]|uniref:type I protein arginine methyltransferase n=1 Tax=Stephanodiscus triporus TaxID=2934178 RepID=A0ABD3QVJ7_9STRA